MRTTREGLIVYGGDNYVIDSFFVCFVKTFKIRTAIEGTIADGERYII
jgi:hypothetical protein